MPTTQIAIENEATVRNLQSAFEGESNAHARYASFAVKADAEGMHGAASLFRATARAEQIHANNHARVIRQLGGEAKATIHPFKVNSTLENLHEAQVGEGYEIDSMYPEFVREAKGHNNTAAILSFEWAFEAEKTHARLFRESIALLESGALSAIRRFRIFYVCAVCGHTSETSEADRCPTCNLAWEKFEIIR